GVIVAGVESRGENVAASPSADEDLPASVPRSLQEEDRRAVRCGKPRRHEACCARADHHDGCALRPGSGAGALLESLKFHAFFREPSRPLREPPGDRTAETRHAASGAPARSTLTPQTSSAFPHLTPSAASGIVGALHGGEEKSSPPPLDGSSARG